MFNDEKYLVPYSLSPSSDAQNFYYTMDVNGTSYGLTFQKVGAKKCYEASFGKYSTTGTIKPFIMMKKDLFFLLKTMSVIFAEFIESGDNIQVIMIRFPKDINEKYVPFVEKMIKRMKLVQYESIEVKKNPESELKENFLFYKKKGVSMEMALKALNLKVITSNFALPSIYDDVLDGVKPNKNMKNKIDMSALEYLGKKYLFDNEDDIIPSTGKEKTPAQILYSKAAFIEYNPDLLTDNEVIEVVNDLDAEQIPTDAPETKTQLREFLISKCNKFNLLPFVIDLLNNTPGGYHIFASMLTEKARSKRWFDEEQLIRLLVKHGIIKPEEETILREKRDKSLNLELVSIIKGNFPDNMDFFSRYIKVAEMKTDISYVDVDDLMAKMMLVEIFHSTINGKGAVNYLKNVDDKGDVITSPENLKMDVLGVLNAAVNYTRSANDYKFKVRGQNVYLFSGNYDFKIFFALIDAVKAIPGESFYIGFPETPNDMLFLTANYFNITSTISADYYAALSGKNEKLLSSIKVKFKLPQPKNDVHKFSGVYAKEMEKAWVNSVPDFYEVMQHWINYTGGDYSDINKMFREGTAKSGYGGYYSAAKMLDVFENHSYTLTEDIEVSRKTSYPKKFNLGKIYVDPAPLSTSLSSSVWSGDNNLLITVPAGTKVLPVLDKSNHSSEHEIILSPGTMIYPYKVVEVGYSQFTKCTVIGDIRSNLRSLLAENTSEFKRTFKLFMEQQVAMQEYDREKDITEDEALFGTSREIVTLIKAGQIKANIIV